MRLPLEPLVDVMRTLDQGLQMPIEDDDRAVRLPIAP